MDHHLPLFEGIPAANNWDLNKIMNKTMRYENAPPINGAAQLTVKDIVNSRNKIFNGMKTSRINNFKDFIKRRNLT
jgi:hypothetical protein